MANATKFFLAAALGGGVGLGASLAAGSDDPEVLQTTDAEVVAPSGGEAVHQLLPSFVDFFVGKASAAEPRVLEQIKIIETRTEPEAGCKNAATMIGVAVGGLLTGVGSTLLWSRINLRRFESKSVYIEDLPGDCRGLSFKYSHMDARTAGEILRRGGSLASIICRRGNFVGWHFGNADLRGADLDFGNFAGADFTAADLSGANLSCGDLTGAKLPNDVKKWPDDFRGVTLDRNQARKIIDAGRSLAGADFRGVSFGEFDFGKADLRGAQFDASTSLNEADLSQANLSDTRLLDTRLPTEPSHWPNFERVCLSGEQVVDILLVGRSVSGAHCLTPYPLIAEHTILRANFSSIELHYESFFRNAKLPQANFFRAKLHGADFSNAKLQGAKFNQAQIVNANFSKADLTGADFSGCDLSRAHFEGAIVTGADFRLALLAEWQRKSLKERGALVNDNPPPF